MIGMVSGSVDVNMMVLLSARLVPIYLAMIGLRILIASYLDGERDVIAG